MNSAAKGAFEMQGFVCEKSVTSIQSVFFKDMVCFTEGSWGVWKGGVKEQARFRDGQDVWWECSKRNER